MTPGQAQGQGDPPELLQGRCVEVRGRVVEPHVDPAERREDRQRRERDPDVDQRDDDRARGCTAGSSGSCDEPEPDQDRVHDAGGAEHQLPGHDPEQVARPERDEQQDQVQPGPLPGPEGEEVGERVGQRPWRRGRRRRPSGSRCRAGSSSCPCRATCAYCLSVGANGASSWPVRSARKLSATMNRIGRIRNTPEGDRRRQRQDPERARGAGRSIDPRRLARVRWRRSCVEAAREARADRRAHCDALTSVHIAVHASRWSAVRFGVKFVCWRIDGSSIEKVSFSSACVSAPP